MTTRGYLYWDTRILRLGMYVNGYRIRGGLVHPDSANYSRNPPGTLLSTMGHSDILQTRWLGADVPVNLEPIRASFSIIAASELEYHAFMESSTGLSVDVWPDLLIADRWHIPSANPGQTEWKTSRRLPYDLPFVTPSLRPSTAYIDDVAQTVVASSPPSAGEVYVPTTGGFATIETPAGISGTWLTLRYHPVLSARVTTALNHQDVNDLRLQVEIEEVRERLFTVAPAA